MDTAQRQGYSVDFRRVSKTFGRRPVLDDVTLHVGAGEIVAIIGRSGVGKSTMLRLIAGLDTPDTGEVLVNEVSAESARKNKLIGFLPQAPALLPWRTVRDNVSLAVSVNSKASDHGISVGDALASVGLQERDTSYPSELSGGMQQRVALARALVTGAPVLLFDEPFASLDEITRTEMYELVGAVWNDQRHTMLLVTHNISEAVLLSDRVIVMAGSPARIIGEVEIAVPRPRVHALDEGLLHEPVERVRALMQGGDQ
jgi:NitT/TauT family transport system ATP-binding protein